MSTLRCHFIVTQWRPPFFTDATNSLQKETDERECRKNLLMLLADHSTKTRRSHHSADYCSDFCLQVTTLEKKGLANVILRSSKQYNPHRKKRASHTFIGNQMVVYIYTLQFTINSQTREGATLSKQTALWAHTYMNRFVWGEKDHDEVFYVLVLWLQKGNT